MIEELVEYIRSKGFEVQVMEGILKIYKYVDDEICQLNWAIHRDDMKYVFKEGLFLVADRRMWEIDQTIAKQGAA